MSNHFGGFNVTTPLSSHPHNPVLDLSSNCIRDYFGSTCQTVFDCLQSRGKSTLSQLVTAIRHQCKRDINPERLRLVDNLVPLSKGRNPGKINLARGSEEHGFIVDASSIRAALIVLIQHSMVKVIVIPKSNVEDELVNELVQDGKSTKYRYAVDVERSMLLPRYPRYIECAKKNYQEEGAAIVEELLVRGRMLTEEVVVESVECLNRYLGVDGEADVSLEQKMALTEKVIDCLVKLVEDGYVELVESIDRRHRENKVTDSNDETSISGKKRSLDEMVTDENIEQSAHETEASSSLGLDIHSLLKLNKYRQTLPPGAVWRVNLQMFHKQLRAFYVGRLVAERYGSDKSYGVIICAALKFIAHKTHSPRNKASDQDHQLIEAVFTPDDIMSFLPPTKLAEIKNKAGGARANLSSALVALSKCTYPQVLAEVEDAQGHAQGGKFEVTVRQIMSYIKGVMLHNVVKERYGDVAARICSILQARGHTESDTIAESAMVPAKDARELLHRLFKSNYISLNYLQQSKQHNPASAFYLWHADAEKLEKTVLLNSCKALYNLRLRRQHEVAVGKDWIERAKEAGEMDENESELDKLNYNKFCQGLERLDNACLELDEILMLLKDFD
jgi:DNA-directed RNA polymerase III subunit RPC3